MAKEVMYEIRLEDVQRALNDALGPAYKVTAKSDSTVRVSRNPVIWGSVRVSWSGGKTTFHVRPGGALVVLALNAIYTVPKVRNALDRACPETS
jgi:hypothetical protein